MEIDFLITACFAILSGTIPLTAQRSDLAGVKRVAYGTLTGFVVAPDETPIPAAQVTLASGVVAHSTRRTAADGSFRFSDIPPAVYEIEVVAPGFRSVSLQSIRVRSRTTTALGRILLDVGQISGCPTLPAGPPTLSFTRCQRCTSALEGAAVVMYNLSGSGVTVVVRSAIGQEIARTPTGSSGRFTFLGLAPGEYTLTASKAGHIDFLADAVTIHDGQRTLMIEPLPIYPCPTPVVCTPLKKVDRTPPICL